MNTPHSIEIVIDENGQIKSEVKGVAGADCSKLSKWLDDLGAVTEDRHSPDYYKTAKQTVKVGK
jgi:hypothetical protein